MKAIIRRQGTIFGSKTYVRAEVLNDDNMPEVRLGGWLDALVFDSYTEAGEWCDAHKADGPFVIEPADG